MPDTLVGEVTNVVDGDTFDMRVRRVNEFRRSKYSVYNFSERIRIADFDAPELGTLAGAIAKTNLEKAVLHKNVCCNVEARDTYGRVVATVEVL